MQSKELGEVPEGKGVSGSEDFYFPRRAEFHRRYGYRQSKDYPTDYLACEMDIPIAETPSHRGKKSKGRF